MSFRNYLKKHYTLACKLQRDINADAPMVEMLHGKRKNPAQVRAWMQRYGLFQGIAHEDRDVAVAMFLSHVDSFRRKRCPLTDAEIENSFRNLLSALYGSVARGWMSATSKLLWCLYPNDFVIYDKFVHRSLVVLQGVDRGLGTFPRIGETPKIEDKEDIETAVRHYMNFQSMVKHLKNCNEETLKSLRAKTGESYPYDLRIIDKVLWMMGNAKFDGEE